MNPMKTAALLLAVPAILSGCGPHSTVTNIETEEGQDQQVVLSFFGNKYEAENVVVIEQILDRFMEENPDIKITYESLKGAEYYDALKKRMDSGVGDDIFMVNHDTVLEFMDKGYLEDLSDLETISGYSERAMSQMREQDGIYFVPTSMSAFGLYCNLDMLEEHGQGIPGDLEEFRQVCGYFEDRGITPIVANNDISIKTMAMAVSVFPVYGTHTEGQAFERMNTGQEPPSVYYADGFGMMEEFCREGYIDAAEALVTKKTSDDLELFAKGDRPFMVTGAWAAGRVKKMNPGLRFEVHPYPVQEDGAVLVINADTRLGVNRAGSHVAEARRFVEYFTRPENISAFIDNQASFSPLNETYKPTMKEIEPLAGYLSNGRSMFGSDNKLELPIWSMTEEASHMLLSGEPVSGIMEWLDQQALDMQKDVGYETRN